MIDLNIVIGGAAGQGLQRAGFLLGKALVRNGLYVFACQDSMSRIRGGYNRFLLRASERRVAAMTTGADILIALDNEAINRDMNQLNPDGLAIADFETLKIDADDPRLVDVPLSRIAMELGGHPLLANSVALGVVAGLLKCDADSLKTLFLKSFKKPEVANQNVAALDGGMSYAQSHLAGRCKTAIEKKTLSPRMFLTGNEAICLGALAADLRFMSAYPMSPSTSIISYLAGVEERVGLVTEQAEDEIAAIHLAFGASMAGARAMTATSGGGLALMGETISLIGAAEVPLVIVNCQRPGPATGLPTRTEQGDLLFSIQLGHGEFPRAVLAPGNAEDAFRCTARAFNLADRFQIPVVVLADQYLSDSYFTVESLPTESVTFETSVLDGSRLAEIAKYQRYEITSSGVSPRAYPGQSDHLVFTDSHEHDESGHITEDAVLREHMVEKRLRKGSGLQKALAGPRIFGAEDSETTVVGWGSTLEPLRECVEQFEQQGVNLKMVYFDELWPFPAKRALKALAAANRLIVVEGNATGQLAGIIRQFVDTTQIESILRYDGRPFMADELAAKLRDKSVS